MKTKLLNHSILFINILIVSLFLIACQSVDSEKKSDKISSKDSLKALQIERIDLLIKTYPKNDSLFAERSKLFFETGNFEKAMFDINKAIELNANNGQYEYLKGIILYQNKKDSLAMASFQNALKKGYTQADVYYQVGTIYTLKAQDKDAQEYLVEAIKQDSTNALYWLATGYSYLQNKEPDKAIQYYENALKRDNANPKILTALFDVFLTEKKDLEKAHYFNQKLYIIDSLNPIYYFNEGLYYFNKYATSQNKNDLKTADKLYSKALTFNKTFANAYYNRGFARQELGAYGKAIEDYQDASVLAPKDFRPHFQLGALFEKYENYDKARGHYKKALLLNPNCIEAKQALSELPDKPEAK